MRPKLLAVLAAAAAVSSSSSPSCKCSPFSGNQGSCCNGNDKCQHLSSALTCGGDTPTCCNSDFDSHCCPPNSACTQGCRNSLLGACGCVPLRNSSFVEEDALYSLAFVAASQCTPEGGLNNTWSCTACPPNMPLQSVNVVQAKGHQVLVGYDAQKGRTVVALRGSLSIQDWISDLKSYKLVPYDDICAGCMVANGFLDAQQSLSEDVEIAVRGVLAAHPTCKEVVVTGHSLGASMAALLLANSTAFSFGDMVRKPVYTFGQPRVGNEAFAAWMRGRYGGNWWYRVVHHDDPVPHLPTASMGFHHMATEIWYAESGLGLGQYEVCDGSGEDGQCSSGTMLNGEITDHLTYMDHPICGCKPPGPWPG